MLEIRFYRKGLPGWRYANFSPDKITALGHCWPTAEHLFQAAKFYGTDDGYFLKFTTVKSPTIAKRMGRSRAHQLRPDWESIKDSVMHFIVYTKALQHQDLRDELLASEESLLIEDSPVDSYWGCGRDGKGRNQLGVTWMEVRKAFRRGDPPPIPFRPYATASTVCEGGVLVATDGTISKRKQAEEPSDSHDNPCEVETAAEAVESRRTGKRKRSHSN